MYTIKIDKKEFEIEFNQKNPTNGSINAQNFDLDIVQLAPNQFHILKNNKSFNVYVIDFNPEEKLIKLNVNGEIISLNAFTELDKLLMKLGMDNSSTAKVNDLKAPMPGLVLEIFVSEGQEIKKGDQMIVLEAMKMENNIKSPTDGIINKIRIQKGKAVEKNQVLIDFV